MMPRRRLLALCITVICTASGARVARAQDFPSTPAGRMLKAWYDAFNSGDSAAYFAFAAKNQSLPAPPPMGMLNLRKATGGVEFVKVLVSEPRHVEFLVKEKASGNFDRGIINVSESDPPMLSGFGLRVIPPGAPPEGCKTYDAPPTSTTPGVANPKDVASEDAILDALYASISGPACQHRDWDRFRSLFAPGARLIPTGTPPNGPATIRAQTPDEYAAAARVGLEDNGFFEHGTARTGENFGHIAHAFSTYESRRQAKDERPFARGINSIQLLNDGTRWWIVTVYWQAERPDSPIPAKYLPKP